MPKIIRKKLVVIKSTVDSIEELGGIRGPVRVPVKLPLESIRKLIVHEKLKVYECNPENPIKDQTRLTKENYATIIYPEKSKKTIIHNTGTVKRKKGVSPAQTAVNNNKAGVGRKATSIRITTSDF